MNGSSPERGWEAVYGMKHFPVSGDAGSPNHLEVYRRFNKQFELVGTLARKGDKFVFRYDPQYAGKPISAFPDSDRVYRSEYLWPFFSVRIPPFAREDMRKQMAKLHIREDQVIEILGLIAKVSITNPYVLKLVEGDC